MEKTALKRLLKFLGSIQLAVPLLGAIAVVLIGATLYEAQVGTVIVQRQIYKSGWFGLMMALLALNLGVSAISRFPWRGPRKIGFALTHGGLILLLAGSAAVIHLGVEGMLPLRTDAGGTSVLRLQGEVLEVLQPNGEAVTAAVAVGASGQVRQREVAGLAILDYRDRTVESTTYVPANYESVRFETIAYPALHLELASERMGQNVEEWLALQPASAGQVNLGPARLQLASAASDVELQTLLAPPQAEDGEWGSVMLTVSGDRRLSKQLDVKASVGRTIALDGNVEVEVANFWPDFRLNAENVPESASNRLLNPALQLQITAPTGVERWFVFGREELEPVRSIVSGEPLAIEVSYAAPNASEGNWFKAIVGPEGDLHYAAQSSDGFQTGDLHLGEAIALGWADFRVTATEFLADARQERTIVDAPARNGDTVPALLVQDTRGDRHWMQWGVPQTFETEAGSVYAVYSPEFYELPFAIALDDFIVERNEGSESVAMWTSQIHLQDRDGIEGGGLTDERLSVSDRRRVWMNHPTWYRGWKIAQASWNPGDLRQSTLQVKREPTWVTALTWAGSAMVVAGIATMFYGPELVAQWRSRSRGAIEPSVDKPSPNAPSARGSEDSDPSVPEGLSAVTID